MRLHEIEDTKIKKLLKKHFGIIKGISINNNLVDVEGDCWLENNEQLVSKLPVQFNKVSGRFFCANNQLTTLDGSPFIVGGDFECYGNRLTSLEGAPIEIGGHFSCYKNKLISLEGLSSTIRGSIRLHYSQNLPLLKLLFVKHLKTVLFSNKDSKEIQNILNKYLGQGRKGALQCAAEMTKAGYKGNAKL